MKVKWLVVTVLVEIIFVSVAFSAVACGFEEYREIEYSKELVRAMNAVFEARKELGMEKGDENLLALTNAGYGTLNGQTTEPFLDILTNVTACTFGTRSILPVHSSFTEPLWCALYRKDKGKLVFIKWIKNTFEKQVVNVSPNKILQPENWKKAASGIIAKNLFSLVSFSNYWAAGAPWALLKSGEFHNHICPGLNAGYIMAEYLKAKHPLRAKEQYLFVAAPPMCAIDALQIMFDSTVGKHLTYAKAISKEKVKKYSGDLWFKGAPISPLVVTAMRVDKGANSCEGVVLGIDWKGMYKRCGINYKDFAPPGGKSNPIFFITRAKMSIKMASMKLEEKLGYVREIKTFFGQAALAQKIANESTDPYAVIWDL